MQRPNSDMNAGRAWTFALALALGICVRGERAHAGNEANFVLYDHHTDQKGTTEINVLIDSSSAAPGDLPYAAQLIEMERALTDQWMAALYVEGNKIDGALLQL